VERLRDKVALISSGAGSIGAATARLFVAEGALVVITDLDAEGLDDLAAELGRGQPRIRPTSPTPPRFAPQSTSPWSGSGASTSRSPTPACSARLRPLPSTRRTCSTT
jgi:NAD(P)-dependent dehydrogenase (short-subunit alcohol dehydrogenase family)